ncbi:hypothetical protein GW17_00027013 [Ensete ventricosum]|nr:hypothetical protein GW17_00027013 [Ensete ventricosum]
MRGWWQSCRSLGSGRRLHPENHPRRVVSSSGPASPKASFNLPCEQRNRENSSNAHKNGSFSSPNLSHSQSINTGGIPSTPSRSSQDEPKYPRWHPNSGEFPPQQKP